MAPRSLENRWHGEQLLQEVAIRKEAEEALAARKSQLEQLVRLRTAELAKTELRV